MGPAYVKTFPSVRLSGRAYTNSVMHFRQRYFLVQILKIAGKTAVIVGAGLLWKQHDMAVLDDITANTAAYLDMVHATSEERIERTRRGLPPALVVQLAHDLRLSEHSLALYLGLSRATLRRRMADDERLSPQESEGPLAMALLAGSVVIACAQPSVSQVVIADPLGWLGQWLRTPFAGLDGRAPIQYMDVGEGRALVARWLASALSPAS